MQTKLDIESALNSTIFLQKPNVGSKYPSLDPLSNNELSYYNYTACKFGWSDSGNLANLAKCQLTSIYNKHFPACNNKVNTKDLEWIHQTLKASYVDDISLQTTNNDLEAELASPTFNHSKLPKYCCARQDCCEIENCCDHSTCCQTSFDNLNLKQKAEYLAMS